MKAISLLQPWASLIGVKLIETRSWSTKYRGPLAIHASKKFTVDQIWTCSKEPFLGVLNQAGYTIKRSSITNSVICADLPTGAVISTCNLVNCIKMTPEFIESIKSPERDFGVYEVGRYAWILEDVKRFEKPIPAKGALSIWEWEGPSDE